MRTFQIKMHTTYSLIDRAVLFCLDLLDAEGRVAKYTKWARHEQDNVTLALRDLLETGDVMGPMWHATSATDANFVNGQRNFG
jgi:hypothetical protein